MRVAVVLLVLGTVLRPTSARGDDDSIPIANLLGAVTIGTAGTVGLTTAIGNGVIAGSGKRPHLAWRVCGIVTAAANLGLVGFWSAVAASGGRAQPNAIGYGLGHLAIGLVDTAMVIWGWTRPETRRYVLAPVLDREGRVIPGASLIVAGW
jgi:hypothetical protein